MEISKQLFRRNSRGVKRLSAIGGLMDQLNQDVNKVEFLDGEFVEDRHYVEAQELAAAVAKAADAVREGIAEHGGSSVAKEYK
ncbi:hypothetical protein [Saccharopolyspora dendranthemae]|uniref:Uncharacterized protein n=1 Tax=Saccharopolyspora dendranthemae TaxID=1181886 RepID=A0A561U4W1_9PSEU|nr:hypothetical protein [Saccharopolyspora dendranthemae]TWF94399.1 hypothetical protein FHU35_13103 [Saccharopolyspora dendranthemae]